MRMYIFAGARTHIHICTYVHTYAPTRTYIYPRAHIKLLKSGGICGFLKFKNFGGEKIFLSLVELEFVR